MNTYKMLYRPASFCTLPKGVQWEYVEGPTLAGLCNRPDLPRSTHRFGVIKTDRPLTSVEMSIYEIQEV
jgi:hypothetical protein